MKTTRKIMIGILALALVFTFIGCGGDDGGGDGGSGSIGANLTLSGQVYEMDESTGATTNYTGSDLEVNSNIGYKGKVEGGKFSFVAGKPTVMDSAAKLLEDLGADDMFSSVSCSPSDAQCIGLELSTNAGSLDKGEMSSSLTSMSGTIISYVYVDRDCTVSGTGKTSYIEGIPITSSSFTLNLETGWNTIKMNVSVSILSMSGTVKVAGGDSSSCNWILNFSL